MLIEVIDSKNIKINGVLFIPAILERRGEIMFYKMEEGKFVGFYEQKDKDKDGNYTEITIEDWQNILDKQSEGEVIFYNPKSKKLETILLGQFETLKGSSIETDLKLLKMEKLSLIEQ